jgi:hypothetical protein
VARQVVDQSDESVRGAAYSYQPDEATDESRS